MKKNFTFRSWLDLRLTMGLLSMAAGASFQGEALGQNSSGWTQSGANGSWQTPAAGTPWAYTGYFSPAQIAVTNVQAVGTAVRSGQTVASITVTVANQGSGYTMTPPVVISGGGGSGATAVANVVNGKVTSVTVTNPGSGYTTNPTVVIGREVSNGTVKVAYGGAGYKQLNPRVIFGGTAVAGMTAAGTAVVTNGVITAVNITTPGFYTTAAPQVNQVTIEASVPEGVGDFVHINTDFNANREITVDVERRLGQLILGDLGGAEIMTINSGANGVLNFDMGERGGGNAFINKFQGGVDVINTPLLLNDRLNVRVTASELIVNGALLGSEQLVSYGAGMLRLAGDNTGSDVDLALWNRGGTGTGAQVLLEATVGNAVGGDIYLGNASYGTPGHAVLQLAQGRSNLDQIDDRASIMVDGVNGRWGYFKMLGGNETIGRIWDMNNGLVFENSEGEAAPTNSILTVGDTSAIGPDLDSYIGAHMRDRSSGTLLPDQTGKLGIRKIGNGTLTLDSTVIANAIIYTGATTLDEGTLVLKNTTAFNSTITAAAGTTLVLDRTTTGAWTFDERINGSADFIKKGIGPVTINAISSEEEENSVNPPKHTFGSLSVQNGLLTLNGNAAIANDLTASGAPGTSVASTPRSLRLTGNVSVGGNVDFRGKYGPPTSTFIIDGTPSTILDKPLSTENPTPIVKAILESGILNVAGSVAVRNTDLILRGTEVSITRSTASSPAAGQIVMPDVTGLMVGMTITGTGVPLGTTITSMDHENRRLTLSNGATIAGGTELVFKIASKTAGTITGTTDISVAGKGYVYLPPTAGPVAGSIQLINNAATNNKDRLPDNATITSKGGIFEFRNDGTTSTGVGYSEKVGTLNIQQGHLVVSSYQAAEGDTATLTFNSMVRSAGGTVDFLGKQFVNNAATLQIGSLSGSRNQIRFETNPVPAGESIIGGWAILGNNVFTGRETASDWSWATVTNPSPGVFRLVPLAPEAYKNTAPAASGGWQSDDNVWMSAAQSLDTRRAINSLKFQTKVGDQSYQLNLGAHLLSIETGGIIANLGGHSIVGTTGLTVGTGINTPADLITHVENGRTLTIQAPIRDFILTPQPGATQILSGTQELNPNVTVNSSVGLVAGMEVTGVGIPAGTTILSVNSATSITLSNAATVSSTTSTNAQLTYKGGSVGLTKSGLGILSLIGGGHTYTGKTYINNGIVQISNNDSQLGAAPASLVTDQLQLNGGALQVLGTLSFNPNRGLTVGAAGGRLQVGNADGHEYLVDVPGRITGIGTLEIFVTGNQQQTRLSVLTLGNASSTNVFGGGIRTDAANLNYARGTLNILGNNTIGGLFLEADGTVNLPGNNNFTEGIIMQTGSLVLSGTNTFKGQPAMSEPFLLTGGDLFLASQNALGTGPLSFEMGTSTLHLGGFNRTISSIISTINSEISNEGAVTPSTLTFDTQLNQTYLGVIKNDGPAVSLVKTGPAVLNLRNSGSSFTGGIRIEDGVVNVVSLGFGFETSALGLGIDYRASKLVLNGGGLSMTPTGQSFTDRSFTLGAGADAGALIANGATQNARVVMGIEYRTPGLNYITPPVAFVGNGPRTLTLSGINAGDNEFNIELGDSPTGATSLLKAGGGTWTLGKDASYTGLTTVQEGVLAVMNNNVLGTAAIPTVANPADETFTGNLPNGVKISFANFVNPAADIYVVGNPDSVPEGIISNIPYYVVGSTGTTFKVSLTPEGEAVDFTTTGTNVKYVANIRSMASTLGDGVANTFTGQLPNGMAVVFNVRSFLGGAAGTTLSAGSLPTGIDSITTYYVINSDGKTFQVTTSPGLVDDIVDFGGVTNSNGNDFYYLLPDTAIYIATEVAFVDEPLLNPAISENRLLGRMGNGAPIRFTVGTGGSLPTGISANTTYYVIDEIHRTQAQPTVTESFKITTVAGSSADIVSLTLSGSNFYAYAVQPPRTNASSGVNLLGGRLDLRNVDYLTPETMYFEGGQLLIPAGTTSTWAGNLQMNVNGNITVNQNGTLILNGDLAGNRTVTQLGEGTIVLRGEALAPSSTSPNIIVQDNSRRAYVLQAGTLVLDYTDNLFSKLVDNATFQMGGSRRGGVLRITGGDADHFHEEIVNTLSLQAGNNKIYRDSGNSIIRLNNIARAVGSSLYFDLARIAKADNLNFNGILGAWALIRDANVQSYWMIPGSINVDVTVDPSTDTFSSVADHHLANGNVVNLTNAGGALPGGLSAGTNYYVVATSEKTFRLSATLNGMAIDVFNEGTGIHSLATIAPQRRASTTTLTFTAHSENFPASSGNDKIEVEIFYAGGPGGISSQLTGAGTVANPYRYKIITTAESNSTTDIVNYVGSDIQVANILTVSQFPVTIDMVADTSSYPPTFLSGGTEDSGSQELDWAKNGSDGNDGFIVPNGVYLNNTWQKNANTSVSTGGQRANGSITNSLRFANSGAAIINLVGGPRIHTIQTGGILVSPTVGTNDSAINGSGQLTTQNQGNLQNFLLHQYNTQGDLIIGAPIVDRLVFTRKGRLSSNIVEPGPINVSRRTIYSLSRTDDLAVGMTVTGSGIPAVANDPTKIAQIIDAHTILLDRDGTLNGGERNLLSFGGAPSRLGSFSHTGERRRIYGITVKVDPVEGEFQERFSTTDLYIGMPISGAGIPAGATVLSIINDADILISVEHFFTGIGTDLTFIPSVGVEKLGPGTTVLGGTSTYTGATFIGDGVLRALTLTDGGVAGSLGSSTNAVGNLTFNGGTLQYIGENSATNRGLTLTEFATLNIGHERTQATFSGAVSGTDRLEKTGSGMLIVKGNAGLNELRVEEGILRVQTVDTNPAPNAFSQSNFGTTGLMSLRMAGGTYELVGTPEGNVSQTYGGAFYIEEGASEIRVVSVNGYDPNNLLNLNVQRQSTLTLMGTEEIVPLVRSAGGTLRFVEDPMPGASNANITLNIPVLERGKVLPWSSYLDTTVSALVNDFAVVSGTNAGIISATVAGLNDIGIPISAWANDSTSLNLDISEGAIGDDGQLRSISGAIGVDRAVNSLRYYTSIDAILDIAATSTLRILSGGIMVGGNIHQADKKIMGSGKLTGGSLSPEGRDMILHNYNTAATFEIGAKIVDDTVTLTNGTVELGKRDLNFPFDQSGIILEFLRLAPGMQVSGPGIADGTVIVALETNFTKVTLSQPAIASAQGGQYVFTSVTSFVQTGIGTTRLTGDNIYNGKTFVHGGVLRLDSPNAVPGGIGATGGTSHLLVEGGVIGLGLSNFTRSLGSGDHQVEFKGSGGFAAYAADRQVSFGGALGKLRYGNDGFVPDGSSLILGAHDATHKVTLLNPVDLGSFSQVIRTPDGVAAIEGELGGTLSGLGRLIKLGQGTLRLGVSNSHSGGIELAEGRLVAANVPSVFGITTVNVPGMVRIGTSRTNTATTAALELEIEGGTITKPLQVGNVNTKSGTWLATRQADITGDVGSQSSTKIVNGYPAMAYYDATNQDLKFVRATDARGLAWGAPVTLASRGDVGQNPFLEIINGNPAVSYYDATNRNLMFVRATDASGVFWAAPLIADANPVTTVAVQTDGKTLLGGTFTKMDGVTRVRMARLNTDGSLDTSFDTSPGTLEPMNGDIFAILMEPDGKILVGGSFTRVGAQDRVGLVRLTSTGALDTSYNPGLNGTVRNLVRQPDGKVLIGGNFTAVGGAGGTGRIRIARLNADGTRDTTFVASTPNNEVRAVALEPGGNVVIGGAFTLIGATTRNRIARLSSTGELDSGFNPNANNEVRSIVIQSSGQMMVGGIFGAFTQTIPITRNRLARLNSDGTVDLGFDLQVNNEVRSLLLQADGKVVLAGIFSTIGTEARSFLGRLNADGTLDTSFNPDPNFEVRGVAQHVDGDLALGGVFSNVGGTTQQWAARLDPDGNADAAFFRRVDDLGKEAVMVSVNGNPAIAYRNGISAALTYLRAADPNGATWTTPPLVIDSVGDAGHGVAMIIANIGGSLIAKTPVAAPTTAAITGVANLGTPVVAYYDGAGAMKYAVSDDTNGTSWSTPMPIAGTGVVGSRLSMILVDANDVGGARPTIAYYDIGTQDLKYVRATNARGMTHNLTDTSTGVNRTRPLTGPEQLVYTPAWGAPVTLDSTGDVGRDPSLQMINGQPTTALGTPAISYYDATNQNLKLIRARNAGGESVLGSTVAPFWNDPVTVVSAGDVGRSSALVMNDGVVSMSYYDATAGDLKYITLSDAAGYSKLTLNGNSTWQGAVALEGSLMVAPGVGQNALISGAITGEGGLKLVSAGTLSLTNAANNFGTVLSGPGSAVDGGMIIRSGTVLVGHNNALGSTLVELGDATPQILTAAYETTFGSLTNGGGTFDPTHNGIFSPATNAPGAFVGIKMVINGQTFTEADAGTLILVKDEGDHPERNGLYQIIFAGNQQIPNTMNLVRAASMDTAAELRYGTRVHVTASNKSYFIANTVADLNVSPVLWSPDSAAPGATLFANVNGLTISNKVDINAGTGGVLTLGGSSAVTGNVTFSGAMTLQDQKSDALETQTLTLTSGTSAGLGVVISGLLSEAAPAVGMPQDVLSLAKTGAGIVTLTGANTYHGTTTVNEGTLLVMNTTGSGTGSGLVTVNAGAILGGTGTIGGGVTLLGSGSNKAILRPGNPTAAPGGIETLTINQPLTLRRESVVEYTLATGNYTQIATPSVSVAHVTARFNVDLAPGFVPTMDQEFFLLAGATLSNAVNWADYLNLPTTIQWDTSEFATLGKIIAKGLQTQLITSHPTSQSVSPGANVSFTVVSSGIAPTYKWRKDGTEIPLASNATAHSATLQINNVTEANEGNYSVEVIENGSQISWAAALAVENPPVIAGNGHPVSLVRNPGETAAFTVVASADVDVPITAYNWYKGATLIRSDLNATLTLTNVQQANEGTYHVEVVNAGGVAVSNNFTLTVNDPILITSQPPATFETGVGFTATFSVTATGTDPQYQWELDLAGGNNVFEDIPGATSATYTTPPLNGSDSGNRYRVKVYNMVSTLDPNDGAARDHKISSLTTVTVTVKPPEITIQPANRTQLVGSNLALSVTAAGVPTLTYQWKRNGTNLVNGLQTNGSTVSGATTRNLTVTNLTLVMAGLYTCEVTTGNGVKVSTAATNGRVTLVASSLVRLPLASGATATLKAVLAGPANASPAPQLSWRKGGAVIPADPRITTSTDGKTLTIKPLATGDSGIYSVRVSANGFTAEGLVADLEVFDSAPVLGTVEFPVGIVSGPYSYQIPFDDASAVAPTTFAAATLPAGLKIDAKTGLITGIPTTPKIDTKTKAVIPYQVKVTISNSKGKAEVTKPLMIEALPSNLEGLYVGPLSRDLVLNKNMGGRMDITISKTGGVTAKANLGGVVSAFAGALVISPSNDPTPELPKATLVLKRTAPLPPLTLTFTIDPAVQRVTVGSLSDGTNTINFTAWRNVWNILPATNPASKPANAYLGYYTLGLNIPVADPNSTTIPQGVGYAAFTVIKAGTLTFAGKTADGETFTSAQFVGPDGEILVFQLLYTTNPKGSLLGTVFIDDEGDANSVENADPNDNVFKGEDTLDWLRPANTTAAARTYKAGFGPIALTAVGGRYFPPVPAAKAPAVPTHLLNATGTTNNAEIEFIGAGLDESALNPTMPVSIDTTKLDKVTIVPFKAPTATNPTPNPNPAKTAITVDAAKGLFSGTFTLVDADVRAPIPPANKPRPPLTRTGVKYFGVIIKDNGILRGYGTFLLPQKPVDGPPATTPTNAPILSGFVDFHTLP